MTAHRFPSLDPAPLLRQLELRLQPPPGASEEVTAHWVDHGPSNRLIAEYLDVSIRTIERWRHGGLVRWYDADRHAIRVDRNPVELWPEWHEQVTLDCTCDITVGCACTD